MAQREDRRRGHAARATAVRAWPVARGLRAALLASTARLRPIAAGLLAGTLATGCALLSRPEGDGGWSVERRRAEIAGAVQAGTPPADAVRPASTRLTLEDALRLAAERNRAIARAALQPAVAAAAVNDARDRLLPNVTGSGRTFWYTEPQTNGLTIPAGVFGPTPVNNRIAVRENAFSVLNGTATVPLDLSGELRHALLAAQAGYRGEQARAWATTLEQHLAVVRAYFNVLHAQQLRAVTADTIAFHRRQLANAEQRFTAGRLTKNEVLVVQVALQNAEQQGRQQDLAIDQARWTLNDLIGLPIDAPTALADVHDVPDLPSADTALTAAYERNPVLVALVEERQRLDATTTSLERGRLPRFSAGGTIDWTTADVLEPQRVGGGFIGFTMDLGLDGRRAAQIEQARLALEQNRLALEQEVRGLESAVRTAQRAIIERLTAAVTAETAIHQAEEHLRIRQLQVDAGRATSEDLLAAEALLASQRATLTTARYAAHVHRAELQRLMGERLDTIASRSP